MTCLKNLNKGIMANANRIEWLVMSLKINWILPQGGVSYFEQVYLLFSILN